MATTMIATETKQIDLSLFQEWEAYATSENIEITSGQLVLFSIAPVQEFIACSRSLRDLWASSLIVSKLVDEVVALIKKEKGFVVFPQRHDGKGPRAGHNAEIASTPHRMLAVVPAAFNKGEIEQAIRDTWRAWAEKVRLEIAGHLVGQYDGWDAVWESQVDSFWEVRCVVVPMAVDKLSDDDIARLMGGMFFSDRFNELQLLRHALRHLNQDCAGSVGRWQALTLLANRLLAMKHSVRSVQRYQLPATPSVKTKTPTKCQMFGTFEVIGPADYTEAGKFWKLLSEKLGYRLKAGERYSAIGMIKRLLPKLQKWKMPRFDDSAKLAASSWLEQVESLNPNESMTEKFSSIDPAWDGRWLHLKQWPRSGGEEPHTFQEFRKEVDKVRSAPPSYYAVLMMDADNCHRRLAGKSLPTLYSHSDFRKFEVDASECPWLASVWPSVLACRRPLTPAYHIEISEKQSRFGVEVTPEVIATHHGQLIYSGGDECLALLPVETVFAAALEIRNAYSQDEYFGRQGSLSAGIAVAHYKADLRAVLGDARTAIERAKLRGKDLCEVSRTTGSGQNRSAAVPWSFALDFANLIAAFRKQDTRRGASDRWLRNLEELWPTLSVFESETQEIHPAILSQVVRCVSRADDETCKVILNEFSREVDHDQSSTFALSQLVSGLMQRYCRELIPRLPRSGEAADIRAASEFVSLCRLAAYFAADHGDDQ